MHQTKEPFELVIHIDEAGTRATASYRLRVFDEADVVIEGATRIEGVTLTELGAAFPWGEFIPAAVQGALLSVETTNAKLAAVTAERDKLLASAGSLTIPEAPLDVSPVAPPVEEPGVATVEALVPPTVVEEPAPAPTVVKEPEPTAEALLGEATGDAVSPLEADPAAGSI